VFAGELLKVSCEMFYKSEIEQIFAAKLTEIVDRGFEYSKITKIHQPNVVEVGDYVFYPCKELVKINLP
jgi:hypothetical protein